MSELKLNEQGHILREDGNLPSVTVARPARAELTAAEQSYLASLPPQSKLRQAYEASDAKQFPSTPEARNTLQALVSEAWMSGAILALIGYGPTRVYLDSQPLWLDDGPILS
jgi:hypothetical protein